MEADLSTLRMLAYDGRPLDITIRQDPEDRTFTLVERDGESRRSRSREADIINSLAHYPGPVRINGKETPATPFPDRAHFRITRQDQDWGRNRSETMEDPPGGKPRTRHNAYAAGVLCYIHLEGQQNMNILLALRAARGKSWQGAIKVELTPAYRLEQDELGLLEESRYGIPEAPAGSELHRELQKRAARQLEESAAHPKAPPRHEGPVHRYLPDPVQPGALRTGNAHHSERRAGRPGPGRRRQPRQNSGPGGSHVPVFGGPRARAGQGGRNGGIPKDHGVRIRVHRAARAQGPNLEHGARRRHQRFLQRGGHGKVQNPGGLRPGRVQLR